MANQEQENAPEGTASTDKMDEMPVKTPKRLRQEEAFLIFWRLILLSAIGWAGYYAWIGMTHTAEELNDLATNTDANSFQLGATILLGAELMYYLYISAAFRQCKEWGMILWALGLIVLVLNFNFRG